MRYRLRTLLILLAIGPPGLAIGYLLWVNRSQWVIIGEVMLFNIAGFTVLFAVAAILVRLLKSIR